MIPVHTHIDSTQFVHPIVPSPDDLNRLADDFKQFLLAVMLGVLERSPNKVVPSGEYQFAVRPGERFQIGNERSFRKSGLPQTRREQFIISRVSDKLDVLGTTQIAALAALAGHYAFHVYKAKLEEDWEGVNLIRAGFASAMAAEIERDLTELALSKGFSEQDHAKLEMRALANLSAWTDPIKETDKDGYDWEVAPPDEESGPRLKRVVLKELFAQGADDRLAEVLGLRKQEEEAQYMLGINGVQSGPYTMAAVTQYLDSGQITRETLLWKAGMSEWLTIAQLREFAAPPPLPSGPPPLPSA